MFLNPSGPVPLTSPQTCLLDGLLSEQGYKPQEGKDFVGVITEPWASGRFSLLEGWLR